MTSLVSVTQPPLEALSIVQGCIEAHRSTADMSVLQIAPLVVSGVALSRSILHCIEG